MSQLVFSWSITILLFTFSFEPFSILFNVSYLLRSSHSIVCLEADLLLHCLAENEKAVVSKRGLLILRFFRWKARWIASSHAVALKSLKWIKFLRTWKVMSFMELSWEWKPLKGRKHFSSRKQPLKIIPRIRRPLPALTLPRPKS